MVRIWKRIKAGGYFFRTLCFIFGVWIITTLIASFIAIAYFFPYRWRYHMLITAWCYMVRGWMFLTCGVRTQVIGQEEIPTYPCVFLVKHSSTWETMILPTIIFRPIFVIKRQLLRIPGFGWGLASCEPIVIDRRQRKEAMATLIRQGKIALGKKRQVMVFPEGTRSGGEYRKGGAVLAKETGVPIVPIAHTAADVWPITRFYLTPGVVRVIIGDPIDSHTDETPEQLTEKAKQWIEAQVTHYRCAG